MKRLKNSGFTLVEVLVAIGILAITTLAISSMITNMMRAKQSFDSAGIIVDLESSVSAINRELPYWLQKAVNASPILKKCLVPYPVDPDTGLPVAVEKDHRHFVCPTIDSGILTDSNGVAIKNASYLDIIDFDGTPLAGTPSKPITYNLSGSRCGAHAKCPYSVTGFMARENATGNPGSVTFYLRLSLNKGFNNVQPFRPKLFRIILGHTWETATLGSEDLSLSGICDPGQYVSGIGANGVICTPLEIQCPVNEILTGIGPDGKPNCMTFPVSSCAEGSYVVGILSNGRVRCSTVTPPPPPPVPVPIALSSWDFRYAERTLSRPIKSMTVSRRYSKSACREGSSYGFSGSKMWTAHGCRASFNITYK